MENIKEKLDKDIGFYFWKYYIAGAFWSNIATPINLCITIMSALVSAQANSDDLISNKKKEIDNENIQKYWDKMKKIGNPYELIYTSYNKKRKNDSISLYSPISRSYFKLWEIYYSFQLFENKKNNINFVHLAEGPGGFMEASINYSKLKNLKIVHIMVTLNLMMIIYLIEIN